MSIRTRLPATGRITGASGSSGPQPAARGGGKPRRWGATGPFPAATIVIRASILLFLALPLIACVHSGTAKEYASQSANLLADKQLTDNYRNIYQREQPFADPYSKDCNDSHLKKLHKKREKVYPSLVGYHDTLAAYMAALAALADDQSAGFSREVDRLAAAVKQLPDKGLGDPEQKKAFLSLAKEADRWATIARQMDLGKVVTDADPQVQTLLEGMRLWTAAYGNDFSLSKGCVVKFLERQSKNAKRSKQYLLGALGTTVSRRQSGEYARLERTTAKATEGLKAVAEAHAELAKGGSPDLAGFVARIENAREALETLNE